MLFQLLMPKKRKEKYCGSVSSILFLFSRCQEEIERQIANERDVEARKKGCLNVNVQEKERYSFFIPNRLSAHIFPQG